MGSLRLLLPGELGQLVGMHFQQMTGVLEIVIIMADGEHGFSHLLYQWQQHLIKFMVEMRILTCRPFIQQDDVLGLGQRQQECRVLLLPFRQSKVGNSPALQPQLAGHLQTFQPRCHQRRIGPLSLWPEQVVRQSDVDKYYGEWFTMSLRFIRRQRLAVHEDLTGNRLMQAGQEYRQG